MINSVEINDLSFSYGATQILKGITTDMTSGKLYALFGPNGSGKSTLLKCLTGLLKPMCGKINVKGTSITNLSTKNRSKLISYVPQEYKTTFPFTVEEIVLMGRTPHMGGVMGPSVFDVEFVKKAIAIIGIEELSNRYYTELSGGQRQLVLLARALAQDTAVMVLDEPTSALDFKNQMKVWKTLQNLKTYDKTIIVCTHEPNHVLWFCDDVVVIKDGEIVGQGEAKDVIQNKMLFDLYGDICMIKNGMICPQL